MNLLRGLTNARFGSAKSWLPSAIAVALLGSQALVAGIPLDLNDPASVKAAASTVAANLISFYPGNQPGQTPGILPQPYYWWESGAMFGTLINYWVYTGDETYNNMTREALIWQATPNGDFMPANQTRDEGNDDQGFWAISAMMAAERNFPAPPANSPSYLEMVQAVFNELVSRWSTEVCSGGLRWQIFSFNAGYNYKNSIANGCFFDIAARLAVYTGNQTYADWAVKIYDWVSAIGLLDQHYNIYDGSSTVTNCSSIDHIMWTYTNGVFLHGASVMYNWTNGSTLWQERVTGLLGASSTFFSNNASSKNVMYEWACELDDLCDTDELSFKAYLARWMAEATHLAPFIYDTVMGYLRPSAQAAAAQCVGGASGTFCGFQWTTGKYDGTTGLGQEMDALEVIMGTLAQQVKGPVSNKTGGTSQSNPAAGTGSDQSKNPYTLAPVTTGDKVGAAVATTAVLGLVGLAVYTMLT